MKRRSCIEIAAARARHTRERVRTSPAPFSPLRGEIAFAVVWLASLLSNLVLAPFRTRPAPGPEPSSYEPTPQELGVPGPLRPRPHGRLLHGRYRTVPSLKRIFRDLRRPVAHDAARAALMARVGSDTDTLSWANGLIDAGTEWRLALHARPGILDAEVVAAWRAQAKADHAAAEAEAKAALKTRIGAANAAEDAVDFGGGPRPTGP